MPNRPTTFHHAPLHELGTYLPVTRSRSLAGMRFRASLGDPPALIAS